MEVRVHRVRIVRETGNRDYSVVIERPGGPWIIFDITAVELAMFSEASDKAIKEESKFR